MKNFVLNLALLGLLAAAYVTGAPQLLNMAAVLLWLMSATVLLGSLFVLLLVGVCTQSDDPKLQVVVETWPPLFKRNRLTRWLNRTTVLLIVMAAAGLGLTYTAAFFGMVVFLISIPCIAICRGMVEKAAARGEEAAQ